MIDSTDNPEEAALLLRLGMMVRDAAALEVLVESVTDHLLAIHDRTASFARGQPLSVIVRKCREVAPLAQGVNDAQVASLGLLLDRVTAVAKLRNAYVHGAWARDDDGSYLAVRGKRGHSDLVSHAVSEAELLSMINEIRSINNGLLEWLDRDWSARYGAAATD
ncbi:hypothetical protein ABT272_30915 [Streptomyces sp900105245]|uniref:Uncharacterized protein n=1 Tax=Streptomyces sp. 900105245 TaxID=3154379 RepID=A0ABV1UEH3_9ACTN